MAWPWGPTSPEDATGPGPRSTAMVAGDDDVSSGRLFSCETCTDQVVICSPCDRGNHRCRGCALGRREQLCREAGRRYQRTLKGQLKHAARQYAYRQRERRRRRVPQESVTHQGPQPGLSAPTLPGPTTPSPPPHPVPKLEPSTPHRPTETRSPSPSPVVRVCCAFCGAPVSPFLRQGFLRGGRTPDRKSRPPPR